MNKCPQSSCWLQHYLSLISVWISSYLHCYYHLAEIMSRIYKKLNLLSSSLERKPNRTGCFIWRMEQLFADITECSHQFFYLSSETTKGALFKQEKQFYRLISIVSIDLALIINANHTSSWQTILKLQNRGIVSESQIASIKVWLTIANKIRLKTYFANKKTDRITVVCTAKKSTQRTTETISIFFTLPIKIF